MRKCARPLVCMSEPLVIRVSSLGLANFLHHVYTNRSRFKFSMNPISLDQFKPVFVYTGP